MTVCYLDPDDEITDAVARLRSAGDRTFILVPPPGSRVATSRINFRLLAREGLARDTTVALVSGEPGVRALAASAGMPAFGSVKEAEAALAAGDIAELGPSAPELTRILPRSNPQAGLPAAAGATEVTAGQAGAIAGRSTVPPWIDPDNPAARSRARPRSSRGTGLLIRLFLLLALVGGGLYAAYLYLPTVSVSIEPRTTMAGPIELQVTADPGIGVPDPDSATVPAQRRDIPLSATEVFPATGVEVVETRSIGLVRFTSENTLLDVLIPKGTRVQTPGGVEFETIESVTIPRASFDSGPTTREAQVRAVRPGPQSNVGADALTRMPQALAEQLVESTNPAPTEGGRSTETLVVTREDFDAAVATLTGTLDQQLATALSDPATTPRGLRLFPETAVRDVTTTSAAAGDLVGTPGETFTLTAESRGTVLAVDETLVRQVAADHLSAQLEPGVRLFPDSVATSLAPPEISDGVILYQVTADGEQYKPLDTAAIVSSIRGKKVSEARGILEQYGIVEISPWPDFIDTVPDDARRIDLTLLEPQRSSQ